MSVYDEIAVYDIPFGETEAAVLEWVEEALELRHGAADDPDGPLTPQSPDALTSDLSLLLLRVRARSDRVDELLAKSTRAKARAKRAQDQAQYVADTAYDRATQENQASRRAEFTTSRERHADAAIATLEERRHAHFAARLVSITTEAHEVIRQVHWQLDAIRKDLRASIHSIQFESSLER